MSEEVPLVGALLVKAISRTAIPCSCTCRHRSGKWCEHEEFPLYVQLGNVEVPHVNGALCCHAALTGSTGCRATA